ncbi:hypothetical protein GCM10027189_00420 [Rufibacter soli]
MVANGQVLFNGTSYSQDFSALPTYSSAANATNESPWTNNSSLLGWYVTLGTASPTTITTYTLETKKFTGNAQGVLSCYNDPNTTLKGLGFRSKGLDAAYGVRLKNTSGKTITNLVVNFSVKAIYVNTLRGLTMGYRIGSTQTETLISPADAAGTWQSIPGSFDRNSTDAKVELNNILLPDGYEIFIRFVDFVSTRSGNEDDLAISNYKVSLGVPTPLPVELTSFSAKRAGNVVNLAWATASEKDNAYFEVQQSEDGKAFQAVEKVKGHGTTSVVQSYTAAITAAAAKTLYFRLKQVDYDGKFEYSKVIAVKAADAKTSVKAALEVYPNPTTSKVTVNTTETSGIAAVTLFHSSGLAVLQQEVQLAAGKGIELDLAGQHAGIYYLQVQTATSKAITRIVKK